MAYTQGQVITAVPSSTTYLSSSWGAQVLAGSQSGS